MTWKSKEARVFWVWNTFANTFPRKCAHIQNANGGVQLASPHHQKVQSRSPQRRNMDSRVIGHHRWSFCPCFRLCLQNFRHSHLRNSTFLQTWVHIKNQSSANSQQERGERCWKRGRLRSHFDIQKAKQNGETRCPDQEQQTERRNCQVRTIIGTVGVPRLHYGTIDLILLSLLCHSHHRNLLYLFMSIVIQIHKMIQLNSFGTEKQKFTLKCHRHSESQWIRIIRFVVLMVKKESKISDAAEIFDLVPFRHEGRHCRVEVIVLLNHSLQIFDAQPVHSLVDLHRFGE